MSRRNCPNECGTEMGIAYETRTMKHYCCKTCNVAWVDTGNGVLVREKADLRACVESVVNKDTLII